MRVFPLLFALLLWSGFSTTTVAQDTWDPCPAEAYHQFDFWIGDWDVTNRFLQADTTWAVVGHATNRVYPVLNGCAIIEHWEGNMGPRPIRGFSIRAYDAVKEKWVLVLNWPSPNRAGFGLLEGVFTHGRGEFFSEGTNQQGQPMLTRYSFSDINEQTFRWDAAYSTSKGREWYTNWIMEFSRRDLMTDIPLFNGPSQSPAWCNEDAYRAFDFTLGKWTGTETLTHADGRTLERPVALETYHILEGCALIDFFESTDPASRYEAYDIRSFETSNGQWAAYTLDTDQLRFAHWEGTVTNNEATLTATRTLDGETVLLRTIWSDITETGFTRTAAQSRDQGTTWTTTRHATLTRKR